MGRLKTLLLPLLTAAAAAAHAGVYCSGYTAQLSVAAPLASGARGGGVWGRVGSGNGLLKGRRADFRGEVR